MIVVVFDNERVRSAGTSTMSPRKDKQTSKWETSPEVRACDHTQVNPESSSSSLGTNEMAMTAHRQSNAANVVRYNVRGSIWLAGEGYRQGTRYDGEKWEAE